MQSSVVKGTNLNYSQEAGALKQGFFKKWAYLGEKPLNGMLYF